MEIFYSGISTAAVATIYLIYSAYRDVLRVQLGRERLLRERVAYLLWVAAEQVE